MGVAERLLFSLIHPHPHPHPQDSSKKAFFSFSIRILRFEILTTARRVKAIGIFRKDREKACQKLCISDNFFSCKTF